MNSYRNTIEIDSPAGSIFRTISIDLGNWWGKQDKPIRNAGTIFKVSWGEPWYQFEVTKYIQDRVMVWKCIDANQIIEGLDDVQKEWVGTKIYWEIKRLDDRRSLLIFQHDGLIPELACYDFCSSTWVYFLEQKLIDYLRS